MSSYDFEPNWLFSQLCQRPDRTIYGIAKGKRCLSGKPIDRPAEKPREVGKSPEKITRILIDKAKEMGIPNEKIRRIKREILEETVIEGFDGKDAIKLFAKKANSEVRKQSEGGSKELTLDPTSQFLVPVSKAYVPNPDEKLLVPSSNVYHLPPSTIIRKGAIGQHEVEILAKFQSSNIVPDLRGFQFTGKSQGEDLKYAEGVLALGRVEGGVVAGLKVKNSPEDRDKIQENYYGIRKALHMNGIAHNALHLGNLIARPDNTLVVNNFFHSKPDFSAALVEALGITEGDPHFVRLHSGRDSTFSKSSPTYKKLFENRRIVLDKMKKDFGFDWDKSVSYCFSQCSLPPYNKSNVLSPRTRRYTPLALSNVQIKELLDLFYFGIFGDFIKFILGIISP